MKDDTEGCGSNCGHCTSAGDKVSKAIVKPKFTPFPAKILWSRKKLKTLEMLYDYLIAYPTLGTSCCSMKIQQNITLDHYFILMWVIGTKGKISEGEQKSLVLASIDVDDHKTIANIVKKSKNSLYPQYEEIVENLASLGILYHFEKLPGKTWKIHLRFNNAENDDVVVLFKQYCDLLTAVNGVPVYKGSAKMEGNAFKLFCKMDFSIFK